MFAKDKTWYVYELIDPNTKQPFYVGKGKGSRIDAHERETLKGVCSKKCNKIRGILSSGKEIIKNKVAFFQDEQAAYDFETNLIEKYGLENLTNILPGGQTAWDRLVSRKSQEFTSDFALNIIKKYSSHFAYWLRHFHDRQGQYEVKSNFGIVFDAVYAAFINKMAKIALDKAIEDHKNLPVLQELFMAHKIDLRFKNVSA